VSHHCHAYRCKTATKPELFMCAFHWRKVPAQLKARIWSNYRKGQCDDKRITKKYADAAKESIVAVAKLEGIAMTGTESELTLYDYLTETTTQLGLFGLKDDQNTTG
jgi:hypothetical protein